MTITLNETESAEYLEYLQSKKKSKELPFTSTRVDRDISIAKGISNPDTPAKSASDSIISIKETKPVTTTVTSKPNTSWSKVELALLKSRIFKVGTFSQADRHISTLMSILPGRSKKAIYSKAISLGGRFRKEVVAPRIVK